MLLEFRSPVFAALFDCPSESYVGDLANDFNFLLDCYPKLFTDVFPPKLQANVDALKEGLKSGDVIGLEQCKDLFSSLFLPLSVETNPALMSTLYWMNKPMPRLTKLNDHNKCERTKLIVRVGKAEGNLVPAMKDCKEVARAMPKASLALVNLLAKAREIAQTKPTGVLVPKEDLDLLVSVPLTRELKHKMALVCTAEDPEMALNSLLCGDAAFRQFADKCLVTIKRAKMTEDGVVEFQPCANAASLLME